MANCKTLEGMINKLRVKPSYSAKKALVVIDAGIATEENLAMIKAKGYDYLCDDTEVNARSGIYFLRTSLE
ncbi:MAG: hypothetical protein LWX70_14125 [Sphingobacteriia bacterium]|jgi:hypothetical protein|nr:hypothetical protein [Sphingobacteriia bacterium]